MSGESLFKFTIELIETTLIGLGIVGNLICIIIFSRKTFRNNSISTYCIALAVFDCMNLTEFATDIHGLIHKKYLHDQSTALCKFIFSFFIFLTSIHPWIMVAFSLDKLLSMRVNSIAILKKKRFQWSIVAGIVLSGIGLYIYIPILVDRSEISPGYFICYPKTIGFFNTHMILIILESNLIPFVIMIITSILTIRKLIESRNSVGQLTRDRKSRDRKYAISSITFNIIFIILKLPVTIFFILSSFFSYFNMYMFKIALLLFFLNSSLSFVIHMVTNSLFKREFFLLFRFAQSRETSTNRTVQNRPIVHLNQI